LDCKEDGLSSGKREGAHSQVVPPKRKGVGGSKKNRGKEICLFSWSGSYLREVEGELSGGHGFPRLASL